MTPIERAEQEWARGVSEPPGAGWERIDTYIRAGLGWTWTQPYTRNRQFEWCGAFAAFAHISLAPAVRLKHLASTYRLRGWARGTARWIEPADIQPGDIVVVGRTDGLPWGEHICIAASIPVEGVVQTLEGNAIGRGPDGQQHEGVVRCERRFVGDGKLVMYAVRPLPEDFQ